MSNIFQPLDVDFFNTLRLAYHQQVDDYQLGSKAPSVPKPFLYRCMQRAWKPTANSRQIRGAWAKAGIYPVSQLAMGARATTPEPLSHRIEPTTPHSARTIQAIDRKVRRGELSPTKAFHKTSKAVVKADAKRVLAGQEVAKLRASQEVDRAARASNKRTRFPQGHLFDQHYQEAHAEEIAEQKREEEKRKAANKAAARRKNPPTAPNADESCLAGPSIGS